MIGVTTSYAALRYGSAPDNCRYVKRGETIIGAVMRDFGGTWSAWAAEELLDLRTPIARGLPTMDAAVSRVTAQS